MNLRLVAGVLVVAGGALAIGRLWDGTAGVVAAGVAALVAAAVGSSIEARRVRRVAERVNAWIGQSTHAPIHPGGSDAWRRLGISLNALGAAYQRRGATLARERPWRRELVDSLVQPALLFSDEGRMLAANDSARDLLGIPVDAVGTSLVQALGSAVLADAVHEVRETGAAVTVEVEHGDHELRADVSLVGDETLLVVADRTQERRVEELRRNFVVNASHELKTPVTSIQTLAEALEVTIRSDAERSAALVHRLGDEAGRLARLVRDLLDLRRLEERGPVERVPVDLTEMIRLVVAQHVPRAEARDVELSVTAPERTTLVGIPGDLEVIVENLVGNAVRYNRPGGSVEVVLQVHRDTYVLRVVDTGIGIPQQDLARIFERFYRVDTARSRETGGTGLGLSLVRHAVERHGGHIRVDSLLGEGSTFTVTLPAQPRT